MRLRLVLVGGMPVFEEYVRFYVGDTARDGEEEVLAQEPEQGLVN